jgi:hypothetical protein
VIQTTVDRDVHNGCVGRWEDTDVACFDLRRGSGWDRIDSTGATIAYPYGLPGLLILHPGVADDDRMLSSRPVIRITPWRLRTRCDPTMPRSPSPSSTGPSRPGS